jgi:hypothetical protein
MTELDHLLWASPDLDDGMTIIAGLTGVMPAAGGSHPGFGTRNGLLSLGSAYLEIIAPDPSQDLEGNRGGHIAALPRPGLLTFAVRTPDLAGFAAAARRAGLRVGAPVAMSRTRPDGIHLAWTVQRVESDALPNLIPFAIDWQGSPHPTVTTPTGCTLVDVAALHPDPDAIAAIYAELNVPVDVRHAPRSGLTATLTSPRGSVSLDSP